MWINSFFNTIHPILSQQSVLTKLAESRNVWNFSKNSNIRFIFSHTHAEYFLMTYTSPLKIDLLIIDNTKYHYFRFGKQNSHIFDFESFEREIVVNIDDFLHIGISVASYKYSKPKRFILFYFFFWFLLSIYFTSIGMRFRCGCIQNDCIKH